MWDGGRSAGEAGGGPMGHGPVARGLQAARYPRLHALAVGRLFRAGVKGNLLGTSAATTVSCRCMTANTGWKSAFPEFRDASARVVRDRLAGTFVDPTPEQIVAWDSSIGPLQHEVGEIIAGDPRASGYSTLLEYELPLDFKRPDAILLVSGGVVVIELKGKDRPSRADIDQVAAYARDLRCYHRDCEKRRVMAVLVPTRAKGRLGIVDGVCVVGPDVVDEVVVELNQGCDGEPIPVERFVSDGAYRPLPSLVQAARELFETGSLPTVKRAYAATAPAIERVSQIVREAAASGTRRLVFVTGIPGAGKTLVGLSLVHARFLDDLSVSRPDGKPSAAAIYLSGNKPLVEVLQYQLRSAGGGGQTFVREVKQYVQRFARNAALRPDHHVVVFDEAQRAHDAKRVAANHNRVAGFPQGLSEADLFLDFMGRIPGWSVLVCLVGSGQEIHVGEEAGLALWGDALRKLPAPKQWRVHGPAATELVVTRSAVAFSGEPALSLDAEVRYHQAEQLAGFVDGVLGCRPPERLMPIAQRLNAAAYHLRVSRNLEVAKLYLRERYADKPHARFGLVASSRDGALPEYGVPNDQDDVRRVRTGPWYVDHELDFNGRSCRHLRTCLTEFQVQGLEVDGVLLAWGTDLLVARGAWDSSHARKYRKNAAVRDPHQLRVNSYRVLLTRARDVCVVFVPPMPALDETYHYLTACGFVELGSVSS